MIAPVEALAQMPESLDAAEAGPLMCAGDHYVQRSAS